MLMEPEETSAATYIVGTRGLLLGDRVYDKGEVVTANQVGKHLLMLVRAGQLIPTDPASPIEKRRRRTRMEKFVSFFKK
jgi:hypothetical protein